MLERYMMIHTGEKSLQCTKCDKQFHDKYMFNRQMLSHAGEKPHRCIQCDKQFYNKYGLNRHTLSIQVKNHIAARNVIKCLV